MPNAHLLVVALLVSIANPSIAQEKEKEKGRKVAFLVGVGKFMHNLEDLKGSPQKDVNELEKVLKSHGYEVVVLTDKEATKDDIEKQFRKRLDGDGNKVKALEKADILLVAVCTHGFTMPRTKGKKDEPFLAAHDSKPDDAGTMVSLNGLIDLAKPTGVTTLFLIDACREINDPNRGVSGGSKEFLTPLEKSAVFFSCQKGEVSHQSQLVDGHGLFTAAVLQTLRGNGKLKEEVCWAGLVYDVQQTFNQPKFRAMMGNKQQMPVQANEQLPFTRLLQFKNELAQDTNTYIAAVNDGEKARLDHMRKVAPDRVNEWRKQADAGNPTGQYLYAVCLMDGIAVAKQEKLAVEYYTRAVKAGHPRAMVNLGFAYSNGRGVESDSGMAFDLYRLAEQAGEPLGTHNLGVMEQSIKNYSKAFEYFERASKAGVRIAMIEIGWMYEGGLLISPKAKNLARLKNQPLPLSESLIPRENYVEAYDWFYKAGSHPMAMCNIGALYEKGRIGARYEKGRIVPDLAKAEDWYLKAVAKGYSEAQIDLDRVRMKLRKK